MSALTGEALRDRCSQLLEEILDTDSEVEAVDAIVNLVTEVQAASLTPADRRGLAAVYGYELGVEEGALEVANIRRLLERHGIRECDGLGVVRSTVAMVEEAFLAGMRVGR